MKHHHHHSVRQQAQMSAATACTASYKFEHKQPLPTTKSICGVSYGRTMDPAMSVLNGIELRHEIGVKIMVTERYAKVGDKSYELKNGQWLEMRSGDDAMLAACAAGNKIFRCNDKVSPQELLAASYGPCSKCVCQCHRT